MGVRLHLTLIVTPAEAGAHSQRLLLRLWVKRVAVAPGALALAEGTNGSRLSPG